MADSFKAVVINNQNENFTREVKELSLDHFKDGEVLVKIDYSDLNWKDAMILKDGGKLVKNENEKKINEVTDKEAEEAFVKILKWLGEDPTREGLLETPKRVTKAFKEYFKLSLIHI